MARRRIPKKRRKRSTEDDSLADGFRSAAKATLRAIEENPTVVLKAPEALREIVKVVKDNAETVKPLATEFVVSKIARAIRKSL